MIAQLTRGKLRRLPAFVRHVRLALVDTRLDNTLSRTVTTAVRGEVNPMVRHRVRIRFRKQDDLRLISHRDLAAHAGAAVPPRRHCGCA